MLNESQSTETSGPSSAATAVAPATAGDISVENLIHNEVEALHEYTKYRNLLPYKTNDPDLHQRQQTLLDFLILNGICTDENFKIFIAEPDAHRAEAERIVDQLYVLEETDYTTTATSECAPEPMPPTDGVPMSPASQISTMTLGLALGSPTTTTSNIRRANANISAMLTDADGDDEPTPKQQQQTKKLFPIFTGGAGQSAVGQQSSAMDLIAAAGKTLQKWKSVGRNQLQIDAGQTAFGGKNCTSCGMFYSVHEPEEERLHQQFHKTRNMLGFKVGGSVWSFEKLEIIVFFFLQGWQEERLVCQVPEWGQGGRIIFECFVSASKSRQNRLRTILKTVEEDLGFPDVRTNTADVVGAIFLNSYFYLLCLL